MQIEVTPQYLASQGLSTDFPSRFWKKVNKNGTIPKHMKHLGRCWEWAGNTTLGYGRIKRFGARSAPKTIQAHIASWLLNSKIPIPKGLLICHHCDNKCCVRPSHLFIGTYGDNIRDAAKKGRLLPQHGEHNPQSVLTNEDVLSIRKLYSSKTISQYALGKRFKVCQPTIEKIVNRKRWTRI